MTKKTLLLFAAIALLAACKKDNDPFVPSTRIQIHVTSAVEGPVVKGINITLLSDDHHITADYVAMAATGADGNATFTVTPGIKYYVYAYGKPPTTPGAVYIFNGKYTSQAQIDQFNFVSVSKPHIGDNMYDDINGDGQIDAFDKVMGLDTISEDSFTYVFFVINP